MTDTPERPKGQGWFTHEQITTMEADRAEASNICAHIRPHEGGCGPCNANARVLNEHFLGLTYQARQMADRFTLSLSEKELKALHHSVSINADFAGGPPDQDYKDELDALRQRIEELLP